MPMIKDLVRLVRLFGELLLLLAIIIAIVWAYGADTSIGANLYAEQHAFFCSLRTKLWRSHL